MFGDWRSLVLPTGHPFDGLLENLGWRGKRFASVDHVDPMVYDRQPIIDHFRRIDERRILGLMDMRGVVPYFFLLTKDAIGEWK